jgi:IS30 family transposase
MIKCNTFSLFDQEALHMGHHYKHLDGAERACIMLRLRDGLSSRAIARELNRSPSSITREIAKHQAMEGCAKLPYEAGRASMRAHMARFSRRRRRKLDPAQPLFAEVRTQLKAGWSPDQIAGHLRHTYPDCYARNVSHETIYTALYALPRGELRRELIACLRQGHVNRWPRSRGANRKQAGFISEDVLIHVRPPEVEDRLVPGHWEGDFIKGAANRSAVGTLVERTSRFVLLARMDDCTSLSALNGFTQLLQTVAPAMRKTMTYDRGSEMARHRDLAQANAIQVYFADPHSPWQRGSNENANGLIREYLPKGTELSGISQPELNAIANRLNNRPRRILGYRTPREVFSELLDQEQQKSLQNPTN